MERPAEGDSLRSGRQAHRHPSRRGNHHPQHPQVHNFIRPFSLPVIQGPDHVFLHPLLHVSLDVDTTADSRESGKTYTRSLSHVTCSWGSGANPWGPEKEDQYQKPTHYDGKLEVVGVHGVVHMGQIQSGLRSATRIAQGGHVSHLLLFLSPDSRMPRA